MERDNDSPTTQVRAHRTAKRELESIQDERGYSTMAETITAVLQENEQLRAEVDNLRTAIGKIPDAD